MKDLKDSKDSSHLRQRHRCIAKGANVRAQQHNDPVLENTPDDNIRRQLVRIDFMTSNVFRRTALHVQAVV